VNLKKVKEKERFCLKYGIDFIVCERVMKMIEKDKKKKMEVKLTNMNKMMNIEMNNKR
jgi:predicted peroxiredoxin